MCIEGRSRSRDGEPTVTAEFLPEACGKQAIGCKAAYKYSVPGGLFVSATRTIKVKAGQIEPCRTNKQSSGHEVVCGPSTNYTDASRDIGNDQRQKKASAVKVTELEPRLCSKLIRTKSGYDAPTAKHRPRTNPTCTLQADRVSLSRLRLQSHHF